VRITLWQVNFNADLLCEIILQFIFFHPFEFHISTLSILQQNTFFLTGEPLRLQRLIIYYMQGYVTRAIFVVESYISCFLVRVLIWLYRWLLRHLWYIIKF